MFDYLVVGGGFTGCILAERIASGLNKKVLLVEHSDTLGGVAFDFRDPDGFLIQGCGLHVVHTYSPDVWNYLSRFTEWNVHKTEVQAQIDGRCVAFPFNRDSLNALFGLDLKTPADVEAYLASVREPIASPRNAEEMALSQVGRPLYEKFFEGYTRKWWGREPRALDPRVCSQIVVRGNLQTHYQDDTYQGVPLNGYTRMFRKMIDHPNITVQLGTDYRSVVGNTQFKKMVFTGAIDDFFDHEYGWLPYRTMRFEYETQDVEFFQACHQVMYPNEGDYMRIFEFKHATGQAHAKTVIIREYPTDTVPGMRRDYPLPSPEGREMYLRYKAKADSLRSVVFLGRLAQWKYYTMGQTVARALTKFRTTRWV